MRSAASSSTLRRCAASGVAAAVLLVVPVLGRIHAQDEVRALWVVRTSLSSPAAIGTLVDTARASGFNALLVQIRGRADAYYADALEPRAAALAAQPAFDPLAVTIARAHAAGLRVHAWINVNLVAGVNELPAARDHVIYRHPEWLMVPRPIAEDLRTVLRDRSPAEAVRYDRRLPSEPLAYAEAFPDAWRTFRADRMTASMSRLRDTINAVRPSATVSAAVVPDAAQAASRRLQDWRAWLDRRLVDVICPMAYTTDGRVFASQIAAARDIAGRRAIWAGIGAYRLSSDQVVENIQAARRLDAGGIILFSYDSLAGPSRGPDYLTHIARAAFSAQF